MDVELVKNFTKDEQANLVADLLELRFDEAAPFPNIGRPGWKRVCLIHGLAMDETLYEAMFDVIRGAGDDRISVWIETAADLPSFEVEATVEAFQTALLSHNYYRIFELALIGPSKQWVARMLGTDVGFMAASPEAIDRYVDLLGGSAAFRVSMRQFWTHLFGPDIPAQWADFLKSYVGCEDL